jgi:hypothetical protein
MDVDSQKQAWWDLAAITRPCQRCVSLFGAENALPAICHTYGVLGELHLCGEHYLEHIRQINRDQAADESGGQE